MSDSKPPVMESVPAVSRRKWWGLAGVGALAMMAILYVFPPEQSSFYPQCIFRRVTGLDCPGCGGLRAAHQLLHGHFAAAWALNPVAVMLAPLLAYEGVIRLGRQRVWPSLLQKPIIGFSVILLFIGFGIVRNLPALAGR